MGEAVHSCNLRIGAAETGGSLDLTGLRESVGPRLSSSNVSKNEVECDQGRHLTSTSGRHSCACMCVYPPTPACKVSTHTHVHVHANTQIYTHTCKHTRRHTHMRVCAHTNTQIYIHIHIHMCTHMQTHSHSSMHNVLFLSCEGNVSLSLSFPAS